MKKVKTVKAWVIVKFLTGEYANGPFQTREIANKWVLPERGEVAIPCTITYLLPERGKK